MPASQNEELSAMLRGDKDAHARGVAQCQKALRDANGHRDKAAKTLKVGQRTFYRWLREYPEILKGVGQLRWLNGKNPRKPGRAPRKSPETTPVRSRSAPKKARRAA